MIHFGTNVGRKYNTIAVGCALLLFNCYVHVAVETFSCQGCFYDGNVLYKNKTILLMSSILVKPEMVVLDPSATTVCLGDIIVFNCSAYSNPQVHTYELYVNGTMVNEISRMGIWNITMATGGVFDYKCIVNNTIGTAMSMDVALTVNGKEMSFCFQSKVTVYKFLVSYETVVLRPWERKTGKFGFIKAIWKADVSIVSPSSKPIEELWVLLVFFEGVEELCHWWKYGNIDL